MTNRKQYIGDGVYADVDRGMIKITTENGIKVTNTIYLEIGVYQRLLTYVTKMQELFEVETPEF